jgi:5-methylcytosine-specific restriction endonuclease McrA
MLPYPHDPEKHFLGKLCKHGHEYYGTGQSLRYLKDKHCLECNIEKRKRAKPTVDRPQPGPTPFDESRHRLGKLCPHGHEFQGTGQSMRYKVNGACVACHMADSNRRRESRKPPAPEVFASCPWPQISLNTGTHYLGRICKAKHDYGDGHSVRVKSSNQCFECRKAHATERDDKRKAWEAEYRAKNKARMSEATQRWRERNPGYCKTYYEEHRAEALQNKLRRQARIKHQAKYSTKMVRERFAAFGDRCAYCGKDGKLTLDHFVPISKGGPDALGNIIPACSGCNGSKYNSEAEEWYRRQSFFSQKRWSLITKVMKLHDSSIQLPLL